MAQKGTEPGWRWGRADLPAFGLMLQCSPLYVFPGGETETWYNKGMLSLLPAGQILTWGFEEEELLTI